MHQRNKHKGRYALEKLVQLNPALKSFVFMNEHGEFSIDFSNPKGVKELNKSLLFSYYDIAWDLPDSNLCPPIPGRADYIHAIAEFIESQDLIQEKVNCVDIGTGASLIYPIIGTCEYNWSFIASDIDKKSVLWAKKIQSNNAPKLKNIDLRLQRNPAYIFRDLLRHTDRIDMVVCNPPFYNSEAEAERENLRKVKNLHGEDALRHNFSGKSNELWCKGGEFQFISTMIDESRMFKKQIRFCSSLVSNKDNVEKLLEKLVQKKASMYRVLPISHGNKKSRVLVWAFD
jgi:23S rRNA (adenine1618-N6)-methyltransferase